MATSIGIISIGEMGLGMGKLLKAHGFLVVTNVSDRRQASQYRYQEESEATQSRARAAEIELLPTDNALVQQCDYILSIVPPRDAFAVAERVMTAAQTVDKKTLLHYRDLNAVSPYTARRTATIFASRPAIKLIDGGIIGGVPHLKPVSEDGTISWHCPSLIVSGPTHIPDADLAKVFNILHLNDTIGAATGLKMCFAVTTKGFVSLATQSFTTAYNLGVLEDLQAYLRKYNPSTLKLAENGLVTMPSKAYRWVHEMLEVSETMASDGGFGSQLFQGVSEVYRTVAEDSNLGLEKPGARVRGQTVQDVVELLS